MAKRAFAIAEESFMKTETPATEGSMAKRRSLAAMIRARMAEPATVADEELWQQLKTSVEKDRLTFGS